MIDLMFVDQLLYPLGLIGLGVIIGGVAGIGFGWFLTRVFDFWEDSL